MIHLMILGHLSDICQDLGSGKTRKRMAEIVSVLSPPVIRCPDLTPGQTHPAPGAPVGPWTQVKSHLTPKAGPRAGAGNWEIWEVVT